MYVVGDASVIRGQGGIFYYLYIGLRGKACMGHQWMWLYVTINPLLLSMESTYHEQVCTVVLGKSYMWL